MLLVALIGKFFQSFNIRNSVMNFSIRSMAQPPVPFLVTRNLAKLLCQNGFCFDIKRIECSLINAKDVDLLFPLNIGYIPDSSGSGSCTSLYPCRLRNLTDIRSDLSDCLGLAICAILKRGREHRPWAPASLQKRQRAF